MLSDGGLLQTPLELLKHLDVFWTFILLLVRYVGFMSIVPGIGMGARGLAIRMPAAISLAVASASVSKAAPVPPDMVQLAVTILSEILLGALIGMVPQLIVSGAQLAGQMASNTMGLAAGALIDPAMGVSVTPLALLLGDLTVLVFLLIGGHHVAIYVASGLAGQFPPGALLPVDLTAEVLTDRSAYVFQAGVILSAPIVVALLLTQFVMGLISKAVPTVNIFIVSFPLTIGIGLILTVISMPTMLVVVSREMVGIENVLMTFARELISAPVP